MQTDPIEIPIDIIDKATEDAKKIQASMDALSTKLKSAGVSGTAFNKAMANMNTQTAQGAGNTKRFAGSFTELSSALGLAERVLGSVYKVAADSYGAFQKYAGSVRDVALASGASAEQSSLFLQVLDDFEVSAENVGTALRAMTKNGMTPTLDTLAQLADQYVAIEDPMKRNEFLLKNLGKAGLSWANALSQGGDALRANAEEVNKNLILTDEQIRKAEMARLAVDEWTDAWEGFKVAVGGGIGELIAANASIDDLAEQFDELGLSTKEVSGNMGRGLNPEFERFKKAMEVGAAATKFYNAQLAKTSDIADDTTASIEELSKANENLIKDAISIQKSSDDYNESQQEILDTIAELEAQKKSLHSWERDKLADINGQLDEQKQKYKEGAEEFGKAQGEKLVMLALEKIAISDGVAGYSEAEAAKAKILLDTAGIAEESAFRQAIAFDMASSALAKGSMEAEKLNDLLRMMSEHGWTIDVAVNVQQQLDLGSGIVNPGGAAEQAGIGGGQWTGGNIGAGVPGFAKGGAMGGWGIVGDRSSGWVHGVSELVYGNARVFSNAQSEKMLKSGRLGKVKGFVGGGDLMRGGKTAPTGSPSSFEGGVLSETPSAPMIEMQASQNAVSMQIDFLQTQMNNLAQSLNMQQQQTTSLLSELVALAKTNPRDTGKSVAVEAARISK